MKSSLRAVVRSQKLHRANNATQNLSTSTSRSISTSLIRSATVPAPSTGTPPAYKAPNTSSPSYSPSSQARTAAPSESAPARSYPSSHRPIKTPPIPRNSIETTRNTAAASTSQPEPIREIASEGLDDLPATPNIPADANPEQVDWTKSFHGLSSAPFSKEAGELLMQPLDPEEIEIKPDGIVYLPEIKYRRILNKAFGPGGWGLAPRGETIVTEKSVTREYALLAQGRLVSIARGEQDYFDPEGIPTATEGCKSNALMRCCKDLGIASELWDPRFIRKFLSQHAKEVWVEHAVNKKRKKITMRKDDEIRYPFKEVKPGM